MKGNQMKRTTCLALLLLALLATACGSASNMTGRNPGSQNGSGTAELPATTQLLVGTLKLEDTDQAVTAKQASDLLPLWQTMKALSESDTAAQQEKDALLAQIQETMTAQQMQTITEMKLTRADMFTFPQGQGTASASQTNGSQNNNRQNGNSSNNGGRSFRQGNGGFGGPPPDGGGFGGGGFGGQGQNANPSQIATAQAARQQQRSGTFLPPALINTLIEYLQKKAGA
jgi:hypothetical protein